MERATAFGRIVAWLEGHRRAKAVLPSLRPGASAKAIGEFERKAKVKLPTALAALYHLHDGQDEDAANEELDGETIESGLFPSVEGRDDLAFLLVPLKELAPGMKGGMPGFRKGWIPFGSNYGGDHIVVDLASADVKKRGRVLQFNHEYGCAVELAGSFEEYLGGIADGLESKKIVWDEESGLSYKRGRDWDDLIERKVAECEEEVVEEKTRAKAVGGGEDDLLGRWEVLDVKWPPRALYAIVAGTGSVVELTARGGFLIRPPKGGPLRGGNIGLSASGNMSRRGSILWDPLSPKQRALGLYGMKGGELLLCVNEIGGTRPASFGRAHLVHRMRRRA